MRFEFEFADASHVQSVLRTIKRINSVFDAYRVMSDHEDDEHLQDAHPASSLFA